MMRCHRSYGCYILLILTFLGRTISGWTAGSRSCEVVGSEGRIGSQWLGQPHSQAVPRGVCPGCISEPNTPIYVCTPASAWDEIYELAQSTSRQEDLVWIGNGLLPSYFIHTTVVVPHYGILQVGGKPLTSPRSPPSFVYGKHAKKAAAWLVAENVQVQVVDSWKEIQVAAARKLLWASCMWLFCHSAPNGSSPLTAAEVHQLRPSELEELVRELWPVLRHLTGLESSQPDHVQEEIDLQDTLDYLRAYSESMPTAIPSLKLALSEVRERNGVWLEHRDRFPQPIHEGLIRETAGSEGLRAALSTSARANDVRHGENQQQSTVSLNNIGLTLSGKQCDRRSNIDDMPPRSAIVVGSGIIGSSVALNLCRRGMKVQVVDCLPSDKVGLTTPASWAWLNANQKSPPSYKWMNQMGMIGWNRDSAIASLPTFNGCLVQYKDELDPFAFAGYETEGPLTRKRVKELEPLSNFSFDQGPVYFFPNEGLVDPACAVSSLREAGRTLGVEFMPNVNVTGILRDPSGRVSGVECERLDPTRTKETLMSDVVVIAAGAQSASSALAGIPLLCRPGRILYAASNPNSSSKLSRILVDTVGELHVLQRNDGTIVAGGGFLEVGGTTPKPLAAGFVAEAASGDDPLLIGARQLAPDPVNDSSFSHTAQAVRPMPLDGLPVAGFLEEGLYAVVTHSGVTLSPLLGSVAAAEISENIDLEILRDYRPQRFNRHAN